MHKECSGYIAKPQSQQHYKQKIQISATKLENLLINEKVRRNNVQVEKLEDNSGGKLAPVLGMV